MTSLRELLALNLRECRRKLGLSQAKLAEKTGLSTQYIAMIELSRKYPSPESLEKLAQALEVDTPELFSMQPSAQEAAVKLQRAILADLSSKVEEKVDGAVKAAVSEVVADHLKGIDDRERIRHAKKKTPRSNIGRRR